MGATGVGAEVVAAAVAAELLSDGTELPAVVEAGASPDLASTAGALFLPPPSRKSVTYQPVPLS